MKETNIKEAISKVLDEKDCFTFFWEHFNGDINTVISEFKKNKVNYLVISTMDYMDETLKHIISIKNNGIPSHWAFRSKIRSIDVEVLFIYGYESIGFNQELFETMMIHDIDSRKDLLTKTVLVTRGNFDSIICERFENRKNSSILISCKKGSC